ncbi:UNVERIFIED_CONTAM: hypothetical protein GTU68_002913 [Idotea baltica]|nr:hypothetical protein [Idotea baltica]
MSCQLQHDTTLKLQ